MSFRREPLCWAAAAVVVAAAAEWRPLPFLLDDALFYPQIAFHIVADRHSSFSGIGPTNGYHPLWMLFNIGTAWVSGHDKVLNLRLLIGVEIAALAAALFFAWRLMERLQLRRRTLGLSLLVLAFCTGLFGLETHISFLAIVLWENALVDCADGGETGRWMVFGLLSAMVALARLDNIFLIAPAILIVALGPWGPSMKQWLLTAAVALPIPGSYLAWNQYRYGHLVPISGAIKSGFPHPSFHPEFLGLLGAVAVSIGFLGVALSFVVETSGAARMLLRVNGLGAILHGAYVGLFSIDPSTGNFWYYAIGLVNIALVANVVASRSWSEIGNSLLVDRSFALLSGLLLFMAFGRSWFKAFGVNFNPLNSVALVRFNPNNPGFQFMLADWIAHNLPANSTILAVDFPGTLAYRTKCNVIALDGLTNDYAYDSELTRVGIADYVKRYRIEYYFGPNAAPGQSIFYWPTITLGTNDTEEVAIFSPLTRRQAGWLELDRRSMVIDVDLRFPETGRSPLALWRIDQNPSADHPPLPESAVSQP